MKDKVTDIVKAALGVAEDDLHRAQAAFRGMNEDELSTQYGQGRHTRGELLRRYEKSRDETQEGLDWVKKQ